MKNFKNVLVGTVLTAGIIGLSACGNNADGYTQAEKDQYKMQARIVTQLKVLTAQNKMLANKQEDVTKEMVIRTQELRAQIKQLAGHKDQSFYNDIKDFDDTVMTTQFKVTDVKGDQVTAKDIRGFELTYSGEAKKGDIVIITTLNDDTVLDVQNLEGK